MTYNRQRSLTVTTMNMSTLICSSTACNKVLNRILQGFPKIIWETILQRFLGLLWTLSKQLSENISQETSKNLHSRGTNGIRISESDLQVNMSLACCFVCYLKLLQMNFAIILYKGSMLFGSKPNQNRPSISCCHRG